MVALKLWGHLFKGKRILIFCDNLSSVLAIASGKIQDPFMQQCLREILFLCTVFQCEIKAVHLPGVENRLADYLSRWDLNPAFRRKFFDLVDKMGLKVNECTVDDTLFNWSCDW